MFNPELIRQDFPILSREVNHQPLIYFDNAATTQKPQAMLEALVNYYSQHNANVNRGLHTLGDESTQALTQAKETIAKHFRSSSDELILTKNSTEGFNLLGYSWGLSDLNQDQVILVSQLEHHSNLIIWQEVAEKTGAKLQVVKLNSDLSFDYTEFEKLLKAFGSRVSLISLNHLSNVTGLDLNLENIYSLKSEYARNSKLVLDIAQSAAHQPVDFSRPEVDAVVFSAHKMYGPMGIGGMLVKPDWLKQLQPIFFGGGMIEAVDWKHSSYQKTNERFVAGTPNVAGAVAWAAALDYLNQFDSGHIKKHLQSLSQYTVESLEEFDWLDLVGVNNDKHPKQSIVSYSIKGAHGHDVAQVLNSFGIAARSGHHCTQPLHLEYELGGTLRFSYAIYNTLDEVDHLKQALGQTEKILKL